jgi:hypothetical protein
MCVDVEAWEHNHRAITEIGVAILDTSRIEWVPPGQGAVSWRNYVEAKHFRIQEYEHLVNRDYVHNNPAGFQYGTTETIRLTEVSDVLEGLFTVPKDIRLRPEASQEFQDIVFVAHNAASDIKFLRQTGFDVTDFPTIKDIIDTQALWQAINAPGEKHRSVRLSSLLSNLEIPFSDTELHNAGNDAVLTLYAFLAVSLLEGTLRTPSPDTEDGDDTVADNEIMMEKKELDVKKRRAEQDELVEAISRLSNYE